MGIDPSRFHEQFPAAVEAMNQSTVTVLKCPHHGVYLEPSAQDARVYHCPERACTVTVMVEEQELDLGGEE